MKQFWWFNQCSIPLMKMSLICPREKIEKIFFHKSAHGDINEYTKSVTEKIASSFIECGACFTGDTKVIKIKFQCYHGFGEFFIMTSENWNRNNVNVSHLNLSP